MKLINSDINVIGDIPDFSLIEVTLSQFAQGNGLDDLKSAQKRRLPNQPRPNYLDNSPYVHLIVDLVMFSYNRTIAGESSARSKN